MNLTFDQRCSFPPESPFSFSGVELALAYLGLAPNTIPLTVRDRRNQGGDAYRMDSANQLEILHCEAVASGKMKTDFKVSNAFLHEIVSGVR